MQTIAACDRCGRGYVTLAHEGVFCLANDGGRLWLLPTPEPGIDDDAADRCRRLSLIARRRCEPTVAAAPQGD
jgi:hypothetical protein